MDRSRCPNCEASWPTQFEDWMEETDSCPACDTRFKDLVVPPSHKPPYAR